MKIGRMLALIAIAFTASISASLAGPCSADIDDMVTRITAAFNAKVDEGSSAQQQADAQPTPPSVAAVLSPETLELVMQVMTTAYAADRTGDDLACKEALTEVQRTIGR